MRERRVAEFGRKQVASVGVLSWLHAALYDRFTASAEPHLAPLRAAVAGRARGRLLELGAGTVANLASYPREADLTALDPNLHMLARLRRKAAWQGRAIALCVGTGDQLPFVSGSFDTVVATLVLCSVGDQARTLAEVRRVLRADGTLLFFEHVASSDPGVLRWQRRLTPVWTRLAGGCHLDRDTAGAIRAAGFNLEELDEAPFSVGPAVTRRLVVGRAT